MKNVQLLVLSLLCCVAVACQDQLPPESEQSADSDAQECALTELEGEEVYSCPASLFAGLTEEYLPGSDDDQEETDLPVCPRQYTQGNKIYCLVRDCIYRVCGYVLPYGDDR